MPKLKHHPDAPPLVEEPICVEQSDYPSLAVFFITNEGREYGFLYAHVISYVLESNSVKGNAVPGPPDRICITFPSHEIVLLGRRLRKIRPLFSAGRATAFKMSDIRHSELGGEQPFITEITVISKGSP